MKTKSSLVEWAIDAGIAALVSALLWGCAVDLFVWFLRLGRVL